MAEDIRGVSFGNRNVGIAVGLRGVILVTYDEGKTWSRAVDAPWGLTGDRHHGIYLPDGRLVIVFRNASPNSRDKAGFIAWVGTYDDIKQGKPGQYRVSLLKTFKKEIPDMADALTAKFDTVFGILLVLAIYLEAKVII